MTDANRKASCFGDADPISHRDEREIGFAPEPLWALGVNCKTHSMCAGHVLRFASRRVLPMGLSDARRRRPMTMGQPGRAMPIGAGAAQVAAPLRPDDGPPTVAAMHRPRSAGRSRGCAAARASLRTLRSVSSPHHVASPYQTGTLAQPRSRGPQRCASSASRFARTRGGAKSAAAPKMPHPQERRAVRPARDRVRPPDAGPLIRVLVFVGSGGKCPQGRETTLARHRVVMLSRRGWEPFGYGGCAVAIVRIGPLWWFRF